MNNLDSSVLADSGDLSSSQAARWSLRGCLDYSSTAANFCIGKSPFTIGRSSKSDLTLASPNVSGRHAELIVAQKVILRDCNSTNGTFLNGRRVEGKMLLAPGDLVQFADMEFRLEEEMQASGERTAVHSSPGDGWMLSRLNDVLNLERFTVLFQPIVRAADRKVTSLEALIRSDVVGLESPITLFQAAVRFGIEEELSCLARQKAVELLGENFPQMTLFLNTHPHEQLGAELLNSLSLLRDQSGSRPLVLEVHESAVPDIEVIRSFRKELNGLDIGLAYDDFGAGQSRLLELSEVPPDYLKFDRSMLRSIHRTSEAHRRLVHTMVELAKEQKVMTVAEGLDNAPATQICRRMGFDCFQGFAFGKPASVEQLRAKLD